METHYAMTNILIKKKRIDETLTAIQEGGSRKCEKVVLWLGIRTNGGSAEVVEVYEPEQLAESHWFRIPRAAMKALLAHLRTSRLFIAAQVHSHPELAFHSHVDDEWAIVRHAGALSLVLPFFAEETSPNTFVRDAAVFELTPQNEWVEVLPEEIETRYRIIDE